MSRTEGEGANAKEVPTEGEVGPERVRQTESSARGIYLSDQVRISNKGKE